jgi:acyl transferase domain-containing protein
MYLGLDRGHFLSKTGQCKTFDDSADGYCRAEGCGMFVLKRLSDAIADNDRIHGVIKGVQVNQSGKASSITHPHSDTQTELFNMLFEKANIEPETINVAELHGTGTQVSLA